MTIIDASPIITKFGIFVRPFIFDLEDNEVDITLEAKYTSRVITGDFGLFERKIENTIIPKSGYNGWEYQFNIRFNSVKMFVQFSNNNTKELIIPGYTGNQIVFGIDVTGDLIKIK